MRAYINENGVQTYKNVIRHYYKKITFTEDTTWVVPENSTSLIVDCVASRGYSSSFSAGGNGGRVQCVLKVTSGSTLYIVVGAVPTTNRTPVYNASDIRTSENDLNSRLVVAGGGGSGSTFDMSSFSSGNTVGGVGGGLVGGSVNFGNIISSRTAPTGGTQTSGGGGSGYGNTVSQTVGSFGFGGTPNPYPSASTTHGGAGGAGWYGGGAGFCEEFYSVFITCAGAGGSSYTHPDLCSEVVHTQGYQSGNGYVTMEYEVSETDEYDYYTETTGIKLIK